ncbi:ABC transporter ATP-binding protein [Paenibacillus sp. Aloe-11]|uniref:ABC transporter ATP-binding protein n=1 Tax=Paenibacillus sp. Aloe-11 TaxID=1050222 RepID=UPI00024F0086|nr:dipeptide/oligopeptide/nickel ABC transporter ATP-binding protein [Paenibacillus sp. Aloe-11]EHS55789.1 peptide ABC transporter ATP-binding protein [Paenibacillus sp. Aloe-11]
MNPRLVPEFLVVQDIQKSYRKKNKVLDGVALTIRAGECVGLIGESGCGKSTLARCIMLMQGVDSGTIWFQGNPVQAGNRESLKRYKGQIQAVFQNPSAALNPRFRLLESVMEPLDQLEQKVPAFLKDCGPDRREIAGKLLECVGLSRELLDRYPHEISGGQKQRLCMARAISVEPALIIMDEPTSSLDTLIQSEMLNLLKELQGRLAFSYLFISHDLPVVQYMCDRVLVMHEGRLVDEFVKEELFAPDRHPYTRQLVAEYD